MRCFVAMMVLALSTMLLPSLISAQQTSSSSVPNLIRYSGTLKDAQGAPLTSSTAMGVTFAIYKQQEGGAAVWQETQNVTPDSSGQYNVLLGSTTATGLPDDLFSQQEQRWLGVQIQREAEQARVMLVSVPYAFKAHEADTLGGLPASAFVKAAPTEGLPSSSNGTALNELSNASGGGGSAKGKEKAPLIKAPCTGAVTTSTGAPPDVIPMWGLPCALLNTPASGTALVNGNLNLGGGDYYAIGGNPVLRVPTSLFFDQSNISLAVGAGTGGALNTFTGFNAGHLNGLFFAVANSFTGAYAGYNNAGSYNSYHGFEAGSGSGGSYNTFNGALAGHANPGTNNVFTGYQAGASGSGNNNTFSGYNSGLNTNFDGNSFYGYRAGDTNSRGSNNVYVGMQAGSGPVAGSNNIFIGAGAGTLAGLTDNNIYIGNNGQHETIPAIRIGDNTIHTDHTYVAGIYNAQPESTPWKLVCVDPTGKLWGGSTLEYPFCDIIEGGRPSDIRDMGESTSRLFQLRPVTFYKSRADQGKNALQYGLMAEEVAKVYPEMVAYDMEGKPFAVKYSLLAPMLLNELQKEHKVVMDQEQELQTQLAQIKGQRQEIETVRLQVQQENASLRLQNAAMQERLTKLESYVATQVKTASEVSTATSPSANGDRQ